MSENVRVVIGQIVGAHGVKGEVKLRPLTDYPERFFDMERLSLYRNGHFVGEYPLSRLRDTMTRGWFLAALEGVETMDQADALRGCTVEITQDERVPLEDGEVWIDDLIGLEAYDEAGTRLGTVKDVIDNGSTQLLIITDDNGKEHTIPAVPEFFLDADTKAGRITLRLIEGLWEL